MTDFARIAKYYGQFDEWSRLDTPEGRLELPIVLGILDGFLKPASRVLDLGGGPGRYTVELSNRGYRVSLGDLSPELVEIAKGKVATLGNPALVEGLDVVNALDLSRYATGSFDAILLFGPLYHLTKSEEIDACLGEVRRVLKTDGLVFGIYMPRTEGIRHIVERSFFSPAQVDARVLSELAATGVFHNASESGFQEGMYLDTETLRGHFRKAGFDEIHLRSIRGVGYGMEEKILGLAETDRGRFDAIMALIEKTATEPGIVESCGHAVYIGKKAE